MKRVYPKDIRAAIKAAVESDVKQGMEHFHKMHPEADPLDEMSEEYWQRYHAKWVNEPHPRMSDDEIREYLGIPVKSQEEIEKEILAAPHREGFTIAEVTGLDWLDRGVITKWFFPLDTGR